MMEMTKFIKSYVLNLIITGIPSIHRIAEFLNNSKFGFKPYYNWNTFNTYRHIV